MAHIVVAYRNKRKPNIFSPNEEMGKENIEKDLPDTLSVSLPWLEKENVSSTSLLMMFIRSKDQVLIFAYLIGFMNATCSKKEILKRRVIHVEELKKLMTTQPDKQLRAAYRYDKSFL